MNRRYCIDLTTSFFGFYHGVVGGFLKKGGGSFSKKGLWEVFLEKKDGWSGGRFFLGKGVKKP